MSLLSTTQQKQHPRRQVQTLRRIAQAALRKGTLAGEERAKAAIAEMEALNTEHQLGY